MPAKMTSGVGDDGSTALAPAPALSANTTTVGGRARGGLTGACLFRGGPCLRFAVPAFLVGSCGFSLDSLLSCPPGF